MADFDSCLLAAMEQMEISFALKEKQKLCLFNMFSNVDTICVLPTGYGKSIIYQLLPCLMQAKYSQPEPMIVVVVTPLNSIMEDQVSNFKSSVISSCFLAFDGGSLYTVDEYEHNDDDAAADGNIRLPKKASLNQFCSGGFNLVYSHPEALFRKEIMKSLHSKTYQDRVCAIVIDEAHMISEWGADFRTSFKRLGELNCIFSNAGHLALTATATPLKIHQLATSLQFLSESVICENPDRSNIFLEVLIRPPNFHKFDKYDSLIQPVTEELSDKLADFPVTIMYMESVEALAYCYRYVSYHLNDKQYIGEQIPENRIFGQYHTAYTDTMKKHIVYELTKQTPKLRLVMATIALGMGLNSPSVTRIIHCRPPTTVEAYVQEIGRAGRLGQPAHALLYYNKSDVSKNRKGMSLAMTEYCKNESSCLRLHLAKNFGFEEVTFSGEKERCCSNCRNHHQ